jgi:aarF domain-containing kinase
MSSYDQSSTLGFSADVPELGLPERLWRFAKIAMLAARTYLCYKTTQLWTGLVTAHNRDELYRRQDLRSARDLYRTAVALEGLLIKASQFIGTRADILPDEWVRTLSALHDRVPPRPFELVRQTIEREMGRPLNSIYSEFDPVPIASASLAQVHRARLHDGRRCAVKVQYPGIESRVRADLRNMLFVLRILAWMEPNFDFQMIAREALKYIPMELDFLHEAENCLIVRHNLVQRSDVLVPEVYLEFTTRRVLTMELMSGIKISDIAGLEAAGINKHAVAQMLTEVYCEQILRDGFFHADPHPGNILVQPGPRLVLLDFGLAKEFPASFREGFVRLTFSVLMNDRRGIVKAFLDLGFRTRDGSTDTLLALSDAFLGNTLRRQKAYADKELLEEISEELPRTLRSNPIVEIPGDVLLISRVMGLLSGLGKTLDSQVDLMATMMPYAQTLMAEQPAAAGGAGARRDCNV